jgi:hypothetical protein
MHASPHPTGTDHNQPASLRSQVTVRPAALSEAEKLDRSRMVTAVVADQHRFSPPPVQYTARASARRRQQDG